MIQVINSEVYIKLHGLDDKIYGSDDKLMV